MNRVSLTILCAAASALPILHASELSYAQQNLNPQFMKKGDRRIFHVEYVGKISDVPPGAKELRVWMPVPQDSSVQRIRNLSFSRPPHLAVEPKYGNKIAYWEVENPDASLEVKMEFTCERLEAVLDLSALASEGPESATNLGPFLRADNLVVVDEEIKTLARGITAGKTGTLNKARAIYDHVVSKMTYDKNHEGWGLGSTRHACEVGKGNCTDFHALFNSLCRAEGIASGFEIGLYLPYERFSNEKLGGYHCWALFRVPGKSWVPVDCSEGDRFPERREYFFGSHTSNRVTLSTGRDMVLEPKQAGPPLNYFLNPHAEADGRPVKTEKTWSYKDLN